MKIQVDIDRTLGRRILFVRAFENIDYNTKKLMEQKLK